MKTITEIESKIEEHSSSLKEIATKQLNEIINSMPSHIKTLIDEAFKHKRVPKEYLMSSILFAFSNAAGLAFEINSLGYKNYGNLYLALIGSRGDVKSPAMDIATAPLNKYDSYQYEEYKESIKESEKDQRVFKKQFFVQNATIEAALWSHYQNPYSIGIFVDEIYYLIAKMGNPSSQDGPVWRTFFLQGNTNKHIDVLRKTTDSFRLDKSYPVLLGSIQNEFISKIFAGGNLESGLVDRMFFTTKLTSNNKISRFGISPDSLKNYSDNLTRIIDIRTEQEKNKQAINLWCTNDAEEEMLKYVQNLVDKQESAPFMEKEYLSKLQINIHKMVLIMHLIEMSASPEVSYKINLQTVRDAITICEFYYTNFKILISQLNAKVKLDMNEVINLGLKNNRTQQEIADYIGINKSNVSRFIKKHNTQHATRNTLQIFH